MAIFAKIDFCGLKYHPEVLVELKTWHYHSPASKADEGSWKKSRIGVMMGWDRSCDTVYSSNPVLYFLSTYEHPAPLHQSSRHIQSPMMFPCTQTGSGPWVSFYKVHVGLKGRGESQWLNECCHSGIALNFDELRTIVLIDRVHHLDCELDNVYFQYSSFSNFQYFSIFVNIFLYFSVFLILRKTMSWLI